MYRGWKVEQRERKAERERESERWKQATTLLSAYICVHIHFFKCIRIRIVYAHYVYSEHNIVWVQTHTRFL